jgi:hypothetical protein
VQIGLFASWNFIFLAFMALGFARRAAEYFTAVRTGMIPAYLLYALVLALIPLACVGLGWIKLRTSASRLFGLGYVIEGPLMLLLVVRIFAIRQATPGILLLMAIALLGMVAFLWTLLDQQAGRRHTALEGLRLAGLTLMVATSLYAAAWITFYALPIVVEILRFIGNILARPSEVYQGLIGFLRDTFLEADPPPFYLLGFISCLIRRPCSSSPPSPCRCSACNFGGASWQGLLG